MIICALETTNVVDIRNSIPFLPKPKASQPGSKGTEFGVKVQ